VNLAYQRIIAASDDDCRDLFVAAARRIGTTEQNVEKDFWVCWTLDALFHRLPAGGPRLLFKGGTSLSKAFGLISRFSEDIDVTVFRGDLGESGSLEELEGLSGKKRRARLDAIKAACQAYIDDHLRPQLHAVLAAALSDAGRKPDAARILGDQAEPDAQTLLFHYPSVLMPADEYVRPSVRIESGAKSALDPHILAGVEPYIAREASQLDLAVPGITAIEPRRTFWDKVIILHGLRRWFEKRDELRQEGQRVTRHYYDLHCLVHADIGPAAAADLAMAAECVRHARMFFGRPDLDLETAVPGMFVLVPTPKMVDRLRRDYDSTAGMILGPIPSFDDVMASIADLEARLNGPGASN